ncbi:cyclodeaminase/cyclohydrolase family protein [Bifidobacterium tsurumiense]|uniref:Methenyl tetrahydrofolate cyclohydrolase n=1 Tax=Bifidobacterium tsurumiense TaxID=356829 RepID=A0A087ECG9_9BIFI|nr:cyclodeaminase/cyclohydrolase family protein [Bifidobacterium tsurumiense]KFJ05470.1 methenyl tetrahydrofolate cyclohydrolase [Bifidobacterium tsurumiense]MDY4677909.1 cyclodeaminase/cyclohydrolase family protein [Bifidobacterium tsurumiense]
MVDDGEQAVALTDLSLEAFTARLAAKHSVPGGGGAAAVVGSLGAALGAMAAHFTSGKKSYAQVQGDIERIAGSATALSQQLLQLVNEDARNFEPLAHVYSMPKDQPGREELLENATLKACEAPLEMMRLCSRSIALLEEASDKVSTLLLSDVACGAVLCGAALQAASVNVFVNTAQLKNDEVARPLEEEADALLLANIPRADTVAEKAVTRIRGKE